MQPSRDDVADTAPETESPPRRRRRRLVLLSCAAVSVALLIVMVIGGLSALGVRRDLEQGREALSRGKRALLAGKLDAARDEFAHAVDVFHTARGGSRSIGLAVAGWIPLLGDTADAVLAIADAGFKTADAASGIAEAMGELPGGLGALAPSADGIPVDRLTGLTEATGRADRLTREALANLRAAPTGFVLSPVASAKTDAEDQLAALQRQLHAGSLVLQGLPSFLGTDRPRHYFFGASNPAELRGTGGLIGAYSILTVDAGRLSFSDFRPVQSLPRLDVADVPSPSPEYSKNFDFYLTPKAYWLNLNMTPDFPLAAEAIWLAYRSATGQTLDGVMVADPFALKALMHVTAPVTVGQTGIKVTEGNIVPFVANKAYALFFHSSEERKLVLGGVAQAVVHGFLQQRGDDLARLRALLDAFSNGHVKAWSKNPSMEAGLALSSVGGAFDPSGTDVISLVTNSASGTKLDFYQQRSITYDIQLGPGGTATAAFRVDLLNDSPTSGYPEYVIGPFRHFSSQPGENLAVVDLYCDAGCVLQGATRNGDAVALDRHEQEGYPFFEDYVRTPSGDTATIDAKLLLTQAWEGDETGGAYELSFVGQTTIRPTVLKVAIDPPEGMRFTSASDGLSLQGGRLMYEGTPAGNLDLRATFAPSLPVRLWREIVRAVT
jgi:Protein of unknown function (DUF4012)